MLHALPDAIPERGATLYEPVSIACHGILRAPPRDGDPVLIVGAGIIGLATLAALKGLFPTCPVTVLARHAHQADAAVACGAENVVLSQPGSAHFEELAEPQPRQKRERNSQRGVNKSAAPRFQDFV